jgi:ubiquinone/menaquinone biosynthesis C-methylase UbiE
MRAVALETAAHPAVTYLAGEMAAMPLPDESADAVLMFLSLHHVPDRAAGAREVRRVLRPGGRLLVRSPFRERMGGNWWYRFFPRAEAIEREMFPTLAETEALFAAVGLRTLAPEQVVEVYAADAAEAVAKLKLRAISTFEHMTEAEIQEGFARMDAALAAGLDDVQPTTGRSDLLVLG